MAASFRRPSIDDSRETIETNGAEADRARVIMIAAPLVLILIASGSLDVAGDATCPKPAEVARRVDELIPTPAGANAPDAARVIVTRNGAVLRLVLLGANANELATRELAAEGSCEDLAAAAAVVVGAWRADLNPNLTPAVRWPAGARPEPPSLAIVRVAEPPPRDRPFAVGLGLVASDVGGGLATGGMLLGTVGLTSYFGLDASLSATTSRSVAVGTMPDAASWSRVALGLGPTVGIGRGRVAGALHVEGLAALLRVRGVDVPNATGDTSAEIGAAAGGRLEIAAGTSAIWIGVDVLVWPGDQRLIIKNQEGQGSLQRLEVVAALGIAIGRFR